jgi:hypothetical protein
MKGLSECPAPECRGGRAGRQHPLSSTQFGQLPEKERDRIEDAARSLVGTTVFRCNYCGCIYLKHPVCNSVMGFLNDPVQGAKWAELGPLGR